MNIYFPDLKCALVVRRTRPKGGRFVATLEDKDIYLIDAETPPRNCEIAGRFLGGWNLPDGTCIYTVYASSLTALSRHRREVEGDWLIFPRQIANGRWCGLILTRTSIDFAIACTPVVIK